MVTSLRSSAWFIYACFMHTENLRITISSSCNPLQSCLICGDKYYRISFDHKFSKWMRPPHKKTAVNTFDALVYQAPYSCTLLQFHINDMLARKARYTLLQNQQAFKEVHKPLKTCNFQLWNIEPYIQRFFFKGQSIRTSVKNATQMQLDPNSPFTFRFT